MMLLLALALPGMARRLGELSNATCMEEKGEEQLSLISEENSSNISRAHLAKNDQHSRQLWSIDWPSWRPRLPRIVTKLPVVVIKVSDDDGANNAGDVFSDATIRELILDTNAIFQPDANLRLDLKEITTLRDTRINRLADWSVDCPDADQVFAHPDKTNFPLGKLSGSQYMAYDFAKKNFPNKVVVYVRRQTYVRAPVDQGYPKSIAGKWPSLSSAGFSSGIDAAFFQNDKLYLFKGKRYLRMSKQRLCVQRGRLCWDDWSKVDSGYPKSIAGNWPGLPHHFAQGIDAAFAHHDRVFFFSGREYVVFPHGEFCEMEGPKQIAETWPSLPKHFKQGIDAVLKSARNNKFYMFKGSEYVDGYSWNEVGKQVKGIKYNWPNLPDNFNNGIESVVLQPSTDKLYFLKGSQYARFSEDCKVVNEGGGGFSHKDLNFIALSSWGSHGGTVGVPYPLGPYTPIQAPHAYLAHEFGHFLDLTHTMPNYWPKDETEATQVFDDYCRDNYANPSHVPNDVADHVWDGDGLADTPGDPGYTLYNNVVFGIGEREESPKENQCKGAGEYKVYSKFAGKDFLVRPARDNVMSYTASCPYAPGNTVGKTRATVTKQQRSVIINTLTTIRKDLHRSVVWSFGK